MKTKNKILIITSVIFAVIAIAFLITGFALSGADILGWFASQYAMLFYIVAGCYLLIILFVLVGDWIKKL